jgi:8-oxo-dGTP pyrophosphatase MutT (NUDIX family)
MTPPLLETPLDTVELETLHNLWGPLPGRHHLLSVDEPFLTGEHQLLASNGRRAEICYIMHQDDPADRLLLHIKTFYPPGAYRLPTGGVHMGETVMATLGREIEEETGLTVGDGPGQVRVERCLGVVSYDMEHRSTGRTFLFATYHFLVAMPRGAVLAPRDPDEQIGGWQWCAAGELPAVADYLEQVGNQAPEWADWGRYRSLSHRFVADALSRLP